MPKMSFQVQTLLALTILLSASCSSAPDPQPVTPAAPPAHASAAAIPSVQPEAMAVLKDMCAHLAKAQTMRVRASTLHDVVAPSGIKSLVGVEVVGYVKRPNMMHVRYRRDDSAHLYVWYDGNTLSSFQPHRREYSQADLAMPSLGALADYLTDNYELALTLADFLYEDPFAAFSEYLLSGVHNGFRYVDGRICHYLSFESQGADFQLWVSSGPNPLPRRFVVTHVQQPGEPQYIADLSWDFDEYLDAAMFRFTPPAGVTRVPLEKRK